MGDPATTEGSRSERQSPLNSAARSRRRCCGQGQNDPRVNKREADQIVIALRDRGFPVSTLTRRMRAMVFSAHQQPRDVRQCGGFSRNT
jgi:hypothetical protein